MRKLIEKIKRLFRRTPEPIIPVFTHSLSAQPESTEEPVTEPETPVEPAVAPVEEPVPNVDLEPIEAKGQLTLFGEKEKKSNYKYWDRLTKGDKTRRTRQIREAAQTCSSIREIERYTGLPFSYVREAVKRLGLTLGEQPTVQYYVGKELRTGVVLGGKSKLAIRGENGSRVTRKKSEVKFIK